MLRSAVIVIGAACFLGGLVCLVTNVASPAWVAIFWGGLIVLGTVWERFRYKPLEDGRPGAGWIATPESFVDDETGKPVRVWLEPATGERRYVSE